MAVEVTRRVSDQLWRQLLQHLEVVQVMVAGGRNQSFAAYLHITVGLRQAEGEKDTRSNKARQGTDLAMHPINTEGRKPSWHPHLIWSRKAHTASDRSEYVSTVYS